MKKSFEMGILLGLVLILVGAASAQRTELTFTTLDCPGSLQTEATDVAHTGRVVGLPGTRESSSLSITLAVFIRESPGSARKG
jgi:hypothetical protein